MSSAVRIFLLVTLAVAFSTAHGSFWDMLDWSTDEPANCPHENPHTHVCSSLQEQNATCMTFKCCHAFAEEDDYEEYDESAMSESDENIYYLYPETEYFCSICYTVKSCSVYRCHNRCCDGYEPDYLGRCQNKTDHIQCQNGGTRMTDENRCVCPEGFVGKSCEIPECECENGGVCMVKDGKPFCNCSYGHYGERCELSRCTMKCLNGGKCFKNGTYEMCKCPHNFVGKYCETYFQQPKNCPVPDTWHGYCGQHCTSNDECKGEKICCKEGCTTVCREPKADHCEYEGRRYHNGQSFKPDPCMNCTCTPTGHVMCSSMSCRAVQCPDGRDPITKPGQCCPTCPDGPPPSEPVIYGCPNRVVYLNTSLGQDYARICDRDVHIYAYERTENHRPKRLEVEFSPRYVRHCHCRDPRSRTTSVQASATDSSGNKATCTFKVVVLDNEHPRFSSCPEDLYFFEDEEVKWREPSAYDNVAVVGKSCTDKKNGKRFPVGQHALTYQSWDYDGNMAFCMFYVTVSRRDTDIHELPEGLRNRSRDASRLMVILGPIIGGVIIVAVAVLLFVCCRRHQAARAGRSAGAPSRQAPAYDNNIYATPGDISIKLPPYSDLPMNPPPYSLTGTEKDVVYMSLAPPSYTNPGYETLKVHVQKPASEKTPEKSEKSELTDKSEDSESTK